MKDGLAMLAFVLIAGTICYGLYTCNRSVDTWQAQEKIRVNTNEARCLKLCDPHPIKWAGDQSCGCDVGTEIRKVEK